MALKKRKHSKQQALGWCELQREKAQLRISVAARHHQS
jgi:hypothetical protein